MSRAGVRLEERNMTSRKDVLRRKSGPRGGNEHLEEGIGPQEASRGGSQEFDKEKGFRGGIKKRQAFSV